jgi:hypothetical protein
MTILCKGDRSATSVAFERPWKPFHRWLSFRTPPGGKAPSVEEVAIPASGDDGADGAGAAICFLMHGFLGYARELYGLSAEDYEVWYVDRVSRFFIMLKPWGESEIDPGTRYVARWWDPVPDSWPSSGNERWDPSRRGAEGSWEAWPPMSDGASLKSGATGPIGGSGGSGGLDVLFGSGKVDITYGTYGTHEPFEPLDAFKPFEASEICDRREGSPSYGGRGSRPLDDAGLSVSASGTDTDTEEETDTEEDTDTDTEGSDAVDREAMFLWNRLFDDEDDEASPFPDSGAPVFAPDSAMPPGSGRPEGQVSYMSVDLPGEVSLSLETGQDCKLSLENQGEAEPDPQ